MKNTKMSIEKKSRNFFFQGLRWRERERERMICVCVCVCRGRGVVFRDK